MITRPRTLQESEMNLLIGFFLYLGLRIVGRTSHIKSPIIIFTISPITIKRSIK